MQQKKAVGVLGFDPGLKMSAEQPVQIVRSNCFQHLGFPSQYARGKSNGTDGMPHIVVAITECAFSVLP